MAVQLQKVLYTAEAVVEGGRQGHGRTADGRLEVDLSVRVHERCPYSVATRGNIEVTLTVDGLPLEQAAASAAS
jgi:organic hydroperoxide reductase OsmC/OhrA